MITTTYNPRTRAIDAGFGFPVARRNGFVQYPVQLIHQHRPGRINSYLRLYGKIDPWASPVHTEWTDNPYEPTTCPVRRNSR